MQRFRLQRLLCTAFVHRFGLSCLPESSLLVSYRPLARVAGMKSYATDGSHAGRMLRRRPIRFAKSQSGWELFDLTWAALCSAKELKKTRCWY